MYAFHASVLAQPPGTAVGPAISMQGREFQTLSVPLAELGCPLPVTFEDVATLLASFEHLDIEPDGYFLWVSASGQASWQVDGHLYDRRQRLFRVDLRGSCPEAQFDRLMTALGCPQFNAMFALVREGVYLSEAEFRRYASWASAGKA